MRILKRKSIISGNVKFVINYSPRIVCLFYFVFIVRYSKIIKSDFMARQFQILTLYFVQNKLWKICFVNAEWLLSDISSIDKGRPTLSLGLIWLHRSGWWVLRQILRCWTMLRKREFNLWVHFDNWYYEEDLRQMSNKYLKLVI